MFTHETISGRTIAYEDIQNISARFEAGEQIRQARIQPSRKRAGVLSGQKEWELWMIRAGISPESGLGFHRIGIYTDFT